MKSLIHPVYLGVAIALTGFSISVSAATIQEVVNTTEGQLLTCLNDMRFSADFGVCLEDAEGPYLRYAATKFLPSSIEYRRHLSILKACDVYITDPADYANRGVCRLNEARNFAAQGEISYLDMLNLLAKATPGPSVDSEDEQVSETPESNYISWTLDVEGYGRGGCAQNELAVDWDAARSWARSSLLPIEGLRSQETSDVIRYSYYDGALNKNVLRTFYKTRDLCERMRSE